MNYRIIARGAFTELRLYGDIGESWDAEESNDAKTIVAKLDELTGPLDVRINSVGGSLADGLAIYNALRRYPDRVITHVDGVAYSAASLILMAGAIINMAENAMLMIHSPGTLAMGNAPQLRDIAETLDKHAEAMLPCYRRAGGPDDETLRAWLTDGKDHYFTAVEAKDLGLVDSIMKARDDPEITASLSSITRYRIPPAVLAAKPTETTMSDQTPATPAADDIIAKHSRTVRTAKAEGVRAEAKRRGDIEAVFVDFYDADPLNPITALRETCLDDIHCDELTARRKLLAYLADQSVEPILAKQSYVVEAAPSRPPRASQHLGGAMLGPDASDKRAEGLERALSIKCGLITDRKIIDQERRGEFLALSLVDIMGHELRAAGHQVVGAREDIARRYVNALPVLAAGPSHGSDHLPAILGNIANLSAMQGWEGATETWNQWTVPGILNNYQTATRANAALLDKLDRMQENQEWAYGDMADVKQRITGYFHGKKYSLSIQAIVNDDLGELARTMQGWGEAANATVGDAVHAVLFLAGSGGFGQTMDEDNVLLFHAGHFNYVASGHGGVPSETTLNAARSKMMTHSDPNNRKIAAIPKFLLHGPALYATVRKVLNSQELQSVTVDGNTGATVLSGSINSVQGMNLTPVEDYRIVASAPAANAWVLAAARRTVEVAGVGGPVTPRAQQSLVSNTPGITYELSMPFGVAALDWRGLYFNYGA